MSEKQKYIIHAEILFDGVSKKENVNIVLENDKITDVSKSSSKADFEGLVTPAFIDAHSHIGMAREGEPGDEEETNDISCQFLPLNDPFNSIYFDDRAFSDAVDFGVIYSCIVPGSGNLIGGKAVVVRNFVPNRKNALLKNYGYKMALGFNPRSTGQWKGERPNTRMGIYAMLENKFDEVLIKRGKAELSSQKEKNALKRSAVEKKMPQKELDEEILNIEKSAEFELTPSDREILKILDGEKTA
ncbi:amidohydrolase, partial [candidate division WOR-3 bacterium]|nr:amidohydrolase [candidate division WOR-3 bacterium]